MPTRECIATRCGREGKLNMVLFIIYFPCSIIYLNSPYSPYKKNIYNIKKIINTVAPALWKIHAL